MRTVTILSLCLLICPMLGATEDHYDPTISLGKVKTILTSFTYKAREVPLKLYLPEKAEGPAPTILLSHGLGGSREGGSYLGKFWAGRGYVVVAMQHLGSDESVWKDAPLTQRRSTLNRAANGQTFRNRMTDVPATLDQLEVWNQQEGHPLHKRLNLDKIGLGGHSYGAVTTQAIAGQAFGPVGQRYLDPRIDAALAMSPSPPKMGSPSSAFAQFTLPALLMTGTHDGSPVGRTQPADRLKVYEAMPAGSKYQLVLSGAEHSAFSDNANNPKTEHNPNHHRVIQALSLAFWDSYLKDQPASLVWLKGPASTELLEEGDRWETK